MKVTLFGMATEARLEHPSKATLPMEATRFPIVTEVRFEHIRKAESKMHVMLFGMATEVRLLHPSKACLPMEAQLLGITTVPVELGSIPQPTAATAAGISTAAATSTSSRPAATPGWMGCRRQGLPQWGSAALRGSSPRGH